MGSIEIEQGFATGAEQKLGVWGRESVILEEEEQGWDILI